MLTAKIDARRAHIDGKALGPMSLRIMTPSTSSSYATVASRTRAPTTKRTPPPAAFRHRRSASTTTTLATPRREAYYGANDDDETIIDRTPSMYDKLINIFDTRAEKDWIGLLASSAKWAELRAGVFERLKQRAQACDDPDEELRLSKLRRKMIDLDGRVDGYRELFDEVREKDDEMWEGFVASRRASMPVEFFQFLSFKLEALVADEDKEEKEKESMAKDVARLLSLCDAYDQAVKDQELLDQATGTFQELLQVDTLEAMNAKIDELAAEEKLSPALMLTAAKAYMSVKESEYTSTEVKDVMAHLYFKMKDTMGRQQPKEVRILKYVLSIEGPQDQRNALEEAFTPGPELEEADTDLLWCEPSSLLKTIDVVLNAYHSSNGKKSLSGDAAGMMSPEIIERMKVVKQMILAHFSD